MGKEDGVQDRNEAAADGGKDAAEVLDVRTVNEPRQGSEDGGEDPRGRMSKGREHVVRGRMANREMLDRVLGCRSVYPTLDLVGVKERKANRNGQGGKESWQFDSCLSTAETELESQMPPILTGTGAIRHGTVLEPVSSDNVLSKLPIL